MNRRNVATIRPTPKQQNSAILKSNTTRRVTQPIGTQAAVLACAICAQTFRNQGALALHISAKHATPTSATTTAAPHPRRRIFAVTPVAQQQQQFHAEEKHRHRYGNNLASRSKAGKVATRNNTQLRNVVSGRKLERGSAESFDSNQLHANADDEADESAQVDGDVLNDGDDDYNEFAGDETAFVDSPPGEVDNDEDDDDADESRRQAKKYDRYNQPSAKHPRGYRAYKAIPSLCPFCPYETNDVCHIRRHVRLSHLIDGSGGGSLLCGLEDCDSSFRTKHALSYHRKRFHNMRLRSWFPCHLCATFKAVRPAALRQHLERTHFAAKLGVQLSAPQVNVKLAATTKKPEQDSESSEEHATDVNEDSATIDHVDIPNEQDKMMPLVNKRSKLTRPRCPFCPFSSSNSQLTRLHIQQAHLATHTDAADNVAAIAGNSSTNDNMWRCGINECNFTFETEQAVTLHRDGYHDGMSFINDVEQQQQQQNDTIMQPNYECAWCSYSDAESLSALKVHVEQVHDDHGDGVGVGLFWCAICQTSTFANRSELDNHFYGQHRIEAPPRKAYKKRQPKSAAAATEAGVGAMTTKTITLMLPSAQDAVVLLQ